MNGAEILALTPRDVGGIVLAVAVIGGVFFVLRQVFVGRTSVGSEVELAPNRKPYVEDEILETKTLDRTLVAAVGLLVLIAVVLPLYWLGEPGRQAGAEKFYEERFTELGKAIYDTEALCVDCHGADGAGGVRTFSVLDENSTFVEEVEWVAPALNTVMWRFSEDEVRYVLNYGRPGTPMAAWGTVGGGALTTQQIDQLITYLWSVQVPLDQYQTAVDDAVQARDPALYERMLAVQAENERRLTALAESEGKDVSEYAATDLAPTDAACTVTDADGVETKLVENPANPTGSGECWFQARLSEDDELELGEFLFWTQDPGSGSVSCARCHVPGAAYGRAGVPYEELKLGAMGPILAGIENAASPLQHYTLIAEGTEDGQQYFDRRIGSGKMPGSAINPNEGTEGVPQLGLGAALSPEKVWALVTYERNLSSEPAYNNTNSAADSDAAATSDATGPAPAGATTGGA